MTITQDQIKFLASKVMADVPEGGGGPSATVLASGKSNNIFQDVTEADRAGGDLSHRQLFLAIQNPDTDVAMGCNLIVAQPPDDPNVSVLLMATEGDFATRADDVAKLEAGFIASGTYNGVLFGNHLAGMRTILIIQRVEVDLPTIGSRLVLVYREGYSDEESQYLSVQRITSDTVQTFTDTVGDFTRRIITVEVGQSLRRNYPGFDANRYITSDADQRARTRIRNTVWGAAAKYYGVKALTADAALGDYSVQVEGLYERVVPSAEAETPIPATELHLSAALPIPGAASVTYTTSLIWDTATNLLLPGGCLPGSLTIKSQFDVTVVDDGGALRVGETQVGTIDYSNGVCVLLSGGGMFGAKQITYTPAAQVLRTPVSTSVVVTAESRSQSYSLILQIIPEPGTLSVSYLAGGRWYILTDPGNGNLQGTDPSHGAGMLNFDTGSLVVTLGALPDVNSRLILTWGSPTQEVPIAAGATPVQQSIALGGVDGAVTPVGATIAWSHGGGDYAATIGGDGAVSGDATGAYRDGVLNLIPSAPMPTGTPITIHYTDGAVIQESYTPGSADGNGMVSLTTGTKPIEPGTLQLEWVVDWARWETNYTLTMQSNAGVSISRRMMASDDGSGNILFGGVQVGSVNYVTGAISIKVSDYGFSVPWAQPVRSPFRPWAIAITTKSVNARFNGDGINNFVHVRYAAAGSVQSRTTVASWAPSVVVGQQESVQLIAGSVLLRSGSVLWSDDGAGKLREQGGSGWVQRGTINYLTRTVTLHDATTTAVELLSAVGTVGAVLAGQFVFRTATAPIRPGSLSIQYPTSGGTGVVTADNDGNLLGDGILGTVDVQTGVADVSFGRYVTAAGNESEDWYDATAIQPDGSIWRPEPVQASALRYAAVGYTFVPIDPEIIGVDPVRLPSDGRVAIFEPGGYVVVHTTAELPPQSVSNGQAIDLGRTRISRVTVTGADALPIQTGYTHDLDAGTVTIDDTTGWVQPVTIGYAIEHMAIVRELDISGRITLNQRLPHAFPEGSSYISSALMLGDRFARVSALWDQETWTGNAWADHIMGNTAVATYNDTAAPLELDNLGVITQRWVVQFTGSTAFRIIGENVGVVATGNINEDCTPVNPITGTPYFTIRALGWGAGWIPGNIVRINTVGALKGFACIRAVQPGGYTSLDHRFALLARVDVDRPGIGD